MIEPFYRNRGIIRFEWLVGRSLTRLLCLNKELTISLVEYEPPKLVPSIANDGFQFAIPVALLCLGKQVWGKVESINSDLHFQCHFCLLCGENWFLFRCRQCGIIPHTKSELYPCQIGLIHYWCASVDVLPKKGVQKDNLPVSEHSWLTVYDNVWH